MLKQKQLISKASSWIHWFIYYVKIQVVILHLWANIWNNSKRAFYILALIHKFCVTGRTFLIAASAFGANVFLSVFACNTNMSEYLLPNATLTTANLTHLSPKANALEKYQTLLGVCIIKIWTPEVNAELLVWIPAPAECDPLRESHSCLWL